MHAIDTIHRRQFSILYASIYLCFYSMSLNAFIIATMTVQLWIELIISSAFVNKEHDDTIAFLIIIQKKGNGYLYVHIYNMKKSSGSTMNAQPNEGKILPCQSTQFSDRKWRKKPNFEIEIFNSYLNTNTHTRTPTRRTKYIESSKNSTWIRALTFAFTLKFMHIAV